VTAPKLGLYWCGVKYRGVVLRSTLYSQPVFVAVLAYIFLGERLYLYHVVGAGFIFVGVLLVMLLKRQPVGSAAVRSKAES
jgi:drug/metabolite transporter (DMT)-like permease